ncbi:MAG TPA: hypothetical protein PKY31_13865 [Spirochaetota bacterium]|nr:hypothetical protein [Spirochaetota bacterium]
MHIGFENIPRLIEKQMLEKELVAVIWRRSSSRGFPIPPVHI